MNLARAGLRFAARLLPHEHRDRYREEILAELSATPAAERPAYTLGVLRSLPALRRALLPLGPGGDPAPLACRWHLHHHWAQASTEDGERYSRCDRCGRDDPRYQASRGARWAQFPARDVPHR